MNESVNYVSKERYGRKKKKKSRRPQADEEYRKRIRQRDASRDAYEEELLRKGFSPVPDDFEMKDASGDVTIKKRPSKKVKKMKKIKSMRKNFNRETKKYHSKGDYQEEKARKKKEEMERIKRKRSERKNRNKRMTLGI